MEDNILIRIAWYDKQINKYDYGNWHHFSKIDYKKKWVEEQNKKYPFVRYWVEGCITSKENEKIASLDTILKSGDMVEIIIDKNRKKPSTDWLSFVKTHLAREKIRYYNRRKL